MARIGDSTLRLHRKSITNSKFSSSACIRVGGLLESHAPQLESITIRHSPISQHLDIHHLPSPT